jgi:hypothetical protein
MNPLRKHLRRHQAESRARRIRGFRKGKPKLGCYRCGYDCYELEGDRCTECNAPIDRGAPWWRDGRWPLWLGFAVAALAGLVGSANRLLLGPNDPPEIWRSMTAMAAYIAFYPMLIVAIMVACSRTRVPNHQPIRGIPTMAIAFVPILILFALGF